MHIVIAEDDDEFRVALGLTLEQLGHRVSAAKNGREAAALCASEQPDLLITDLLMPEREGLETIAALRKKSPQVPIIAMSGGARMSVGDLLNIARRMGAVETLAKPFSRSELEQAIASAMRRAPGSKPPS